MSTRTEPPRADRRFVLRLIAVSVVCIAAVGLWTRGRSSVLAVEARLPALQALAQAHGLPLDALLAACVLEAHEEPVRDDALVAAELERHLRASGGDIEAALRRFGGDPLAGRRVVDLWRNLHERWGRLAARQ